MKDLSIVEIQGAINISERQISVILKEKTGLSFRQFLNKLRLAEAKTLLMETDLQISEIAFKVGYGNPSHFNSVFKAFEKCTPKEYRKKK